MDNRKSLKVFMDKTQVGTLALYDSWRVAFEYTDEWIANGFSISPFSLPLVKNVFIPKIESPFDGLFGVFWDSLPDGWGRLLVDRMLLKNGVNPEEVMPLTRLAIVGNNGMGALSYKPSAMDDFLIGNKSFDELSEEATKILNDKKSDSLDELYAAGGSSGGARPKILTKIEGEEWIVKFRSSEDPKDIGYIEYEYNLCARECGIEIPDVALLPSNICDGYFAVKRFDRNPSVHMISASALLEVSHRIPTLDYNSLMQLTLELTKSYAEVEKLYRLMCFNVFAHNRDDHSNNFTYLYKDGAWILSPAYDLTYSSSIGGEHATTVNGNGKNPGMEEVLAVADKIGLQKNKARAIAQAIHDKTQTLRDYYPEPKFNRETLEALEEAKAMKEGRIEAEIEKEER